MVVHAVIIVLYKTESQLGFWIMFQALNFPAIIINNAMITSVTFVLTAWFNL